VLAGMVAHALDHCGDPGVSYAEPLADPPPQEHLARGGTVGDRVAGDDLLTCVEHRFAGRPYDDPPAREALADVVVGVALETERDATGQERPEGLARRSEEGQVDRAVGQALAPVALGHLVTEHGADRAVDVA